MAYQTPHFPNAQVLEQQENAVMIEFPFCGLFLGGRKRNDPNSNDVMDSINFRSTTAGPRQDRSREDLEGIIDHLYVVLETIGLVEKFWEEIRYMQENQPNMEEMNEDDHADLKLQDAVKLSGRIITYWEEEWRSDTVQAKQERVVREKAVQLMGDLMEGIQDEIAETFDGVGKVSLQRARLWLQMGGFDKNAPYRECYETEVANKDGAGDARKSGRQLGQQKRFPCSQCPEAFDLAVQLEDHLRQNHGGHGVGRWLTSTLKHKVFGTLARRMGINGKVENKQTEERADTRAETSKTGPAPSSPQLREGWLDVAGSTGPLHLPEPLLQPVQCSTCPKTYTSLTALRNHRQTEHSEITYAKVVAGPEPPMTGRDDGTDSGTDA
jgi:hypothetical protein